MIRTLILAFCLSGFLAGCSQPIVDTTVPEFVAAYDANEAAAQQRFGGREVRFSAVVEKVNLGPDDQPFVNLSSDGTLLPVQLKFAPGWTSQASELVKGTAYRFRCGQVSEVMGTPMLGNCVIDG